MNSILAMLILSVSPLIKKRPAMIGKTSGYHITPGDVWYPQYTSLT
jgi:hypothetical protein